MTGGPSPRPAPPAWDHPRRYLELLDSPWGRLLVTVQDAVSYATATFWAARGVPTLHLPVTTGAVSSPMGLGADSIPVRVELGGIPVYLADSMQFMLEYGCRLSERGCYYLMPSFRGEHPDATHLSQFFHSEAELPGELETVIGCVEDYLRHLARHLLTACPQMIASAAGTTAHVEVVAEDDRPFERVPFAEAASRLGGDETLVRTGQAPGGRWRVLTRAGERQLLAACGGRVWVSDFDHLAVPFYQGFGDPDGATARTADLLLGAGEVVGAGQRHRDPDEVHRALALHHVPAQPYEWYVRMREVRPMLTSGFGMGVERLLMWALDHDDIRDLQLLVRTNTGRCAP